MLVDIMTNNTRGTPQAVLICTQHLPVTYWRSSVEKKYLTRRATFNSFS